MPFTDGLEPAAPIAADEIFRVYASDELGADGYPPIWHSVIKHAVREHAGHRCERCHHPYRKGEHKNGEWSSCDRLCAHGPDATRLARTNYLKNLDGDTVIVLQEARWRILTVHHLNGDKADCRWWNLAGLCQRCHLTIQGRVKMERAFIFEHSDWMKPHAAGFYATKYEGVDLSREETLVRLDELLAYERLG